MVAKLPDSNADIIALNLVHDAIVDEINKPGEALALLFSRMASISRDIGGDFRADRADWQDVLDNLPDIDESEFKSIAGSQSLLIGNSWAKNWMLCLIAKHLHALLEEQCLDH